MTLDNIEDSQVFLPSSRKLGKYLGKYASSNFLTVHGSYLKNYPMGFLRW